MNENHDPVFTRQLDELKRILSTLRDATKELDSWYAETTAILGTDDPQGKGVPLRLKELMLDTSVLSLAMKANRAFNLLSIDPNSDARTAPESSAASLHGAPATSGEAPPFRSEPLSPELLEWARQQFTEEELVAGLREVRETGGCEFSDFIHELEEAAGPDE